MLMSCFAEPMEIVQRRIDLLCVGELLVDMIATKYGSFTTCSEFSRYAGGAPANITSNGRRLGLRASLAAAVGTDGLGDFLLDSLERADIDSSLVQRYDESTSLVVITRSQESPIPIFYRGADSKIILSRELIDTLHDSSILHFSCWPLSMEPSRSSIVSMIEIARNLGVLVCFDPNYHRSIWQDRHEALSLIERTLPYVDIIKPSEDDANRLFGMDDPIRHIRRYLDLGAKLVIMTLGKDGAIASEGKEMREYPSLAHGVVDTTGAGDAFWSGLYVGIVNGRSLDASIRLGMAVCALKLRGVGAAIPQTTITELENELALWTENVHGLHK